MITVEDFEEFCAQIDLPPLLPWQRKLVAQLLDQFNAEQEHDA